MGTSDPRVSDTGVAGVNAVRCEPAAVPQLQSAHWAAKAIASRRDATLDVVYVDAEAIESGRRLGDPQE